MMPARTLWLLVAIQFVSMGAMELSGPFWPLHLARLEAGQPTAQLAWLSALVYAGPQLMAMFATPLWGRLGDRTGHKPMVVRALLALVLCQALAALATQAWQVLAIRALQGGVAGFIAAAQAYAMVLCAPDASGRHLARLQAATAVGSLAGPVLGGWLYDTAGFAALCWAATVLCGLCLLVSLILPTDAPRGEQPRAGLPRAVGLLDQPLFWGVLAIIVMIQAAKQMPQPFFALYLDQVLIAPAWLTGMCYAASAATLALSAPFWGRLFDRRDSAGALRLLEQAAWCSALTLVASALSTDWMGLLASRLVWGVWLGALLPLSYALISRTVAGGRHGLALGLGNSAAKLGALLGSVLGAAGMAFTGLAQAFWWVALGYAVAALGIHWVRRRQARRPSELFVVTSQ